MLTFEQEEGKEIEGISPEKAREVLQGLLQSSGVPNEVKTSILGSIWVASVDGFRGLEDRMLRDGVYESNLHTHRFGLSHLISKGEHLLMLIQQHGLVSNAPFTVDDIKATLESLYDSFRGEHRKSNSEKTNREIAKLFGK